MATYNSPNLGHLAGVPRQDSDIINPGMEGLIVADAPAMVVEDMVIAANQTINDVHVPLMYDAQKNLVPAAAGTPAVALSMRPIVTGAAPLKGEPVLRQAAINMDMVSWPASYDSEEKKLEAFRGAEAPTAIVVKKVRKGATVAQP